MPLDAQHLTGTLVSSALVLLVMYRRFRRNFGKQRLRPGWMIFRMVLLSLVGLFLIGLTLSNSTMALATAAGLVIGVGLAVWGASRTRFLKEAEQLYYIPHTYTGLVVTALFLGRIIYRFIALSPVVTAAREASAGGAAPSPDQFSSYAAYTHNPITRVIFFILIGYYVYYYFRVLWESHHLKPEDWERPDSPATNSSV